MRLTTWSLLFRETNRVWFAFHYSWEQSWDLQDTREWGSCGSANHSGHILDLQLCSLPVTKVSTSTVELGSANEDLVVHLVHLWVLKFVKSVVLASHGYCPVKSCNHTFCLQLQEWSSHDGHVRVSNWTCAHITSGKCPDNPGELRWRTLDFSVTWLRSFLWQSEVGHHADTNKSQSVADPGFSWEGCQLPKWVC